MAKKNKDLIFITILQNGMEIREAFWPVSKPKHIKLTSSSSGLLSLPLYPLAEDIGLLTVQKKGVLLHLENPWNGFFTSEGMEIYLNPHDRSEKNYKLFSGDYVNMTLGDLRVMIKIGPPVSHKEPPINPRYKGQLSQLLFHNPSEVSGLMYGILLAGIVFLTALITLMFNSSQNMRRFEDLEDIYTLPFIHADSLKTAPEALQDSLDRSNLIGSVVHYYRNISMMFMGWPIGDRDSLFPSSVDLYKKIYQQFNKTLQESDEAQKLSNRRLKLVRENSLFNVPAIYGESFRQKLFRLSKKIESLHEGYELSLNLRRKTTRRFLEIPEYRWGEYQSKETLISSKKVAGMQGAEELTKISVFHQKTNEEAMYDSANKVAEKAQSIQNYLKRRSEPQQLLTIHNTREITIPAGVSYISFLTPESLAHNPDERLDSLEGMLFDNPEHTPREPLIGRINPRQIESIVKRHRFQLNLCYELALRRNQNLRGDMHLIWKIDSRGRVYDISLLRTSLKDRQMINCVRRKLASWLFPRPKKGSVKISHAFTFEPKNG